MNSIAHIPLEEQRIYPIDEFLLILHPMERYTRIIYLDFHRRNKRFSFHPQILFFFGLLVLTPDAIGNIIKIALCVNSSNLTQAQQVCATFSLEILCYIRLLNVVAKYKKMQHFANAIDDIYPRTYRLQQRFNVPKVALALKKRFCYLYWYVTFATICFAGIPFCKYLMFYAGDPMPEEFHQHQSWLPFDIKQRVKYYYYAYAYETLTTFLGISCLLTWDRFFVIAVSILSMQFAFLNDEIKSIKPEDSLDEEKLNAFMCHVKNCLEYQQLLQSLANEITDIFGLTILISDMVCASSICLHLYLVVNTDDLMSFLMFLFPIFALVFILYDISKHGTHLTEKSSEIRSSLYNQQWYNGSPQYRKLLVMWLHYANTPCTISALQIFEVGMVHFKKMATLTYQLFTFIQSRKYEKK